MCENLNRVRKEQTLIELNQLRDEVGAWFAKRVAADVLRQYETQLAALKKLLDEASGYVRNEIELLDPQAAAGEFYEQCRLFDLRVLWLRRVWNFYREKFDQRDDPLFQDVLRAADEVVWSCFQQVFNAEKKRRPAPLPFIEASYSPESFPSELVPYNLKPAENGFLQGLMNRLPIPLVSLPQSCIRFPWQMVYIGHEIGHQIQYALVDNKALVGAFQNRIDEIIVARTGDAEYAEKWGYWGREIFADVFSVFMMGHWALRTMVDFEIQKTAAMLKPRAQYPSPVVRLALLKAVADKLNLDGAAALGGVDLVGTAKGCAETERDLAFVPDIVEMALGELPGTALKLETAVDFRPQEFQPGGIVDALAADLKNDSGDPTGNLRTPRLVACAASAVWAELVETMPETSAARRAALARTTTDLIFKSRPEGERHAASGEDGAADLGRELSELLISADKDLLEA